MQSADAAEHQRALLGLGKPTQGESRATEGDASDYRRLCCRGMLAILCAGPTTAIQGASVSTRVVLPGPAAWPACERPQGSAHRAARETTGTGGGTPETGRRRAGTGRRRARVLRRAGREWPWAVPGMSEKVLGRKMRIFRLCQSPLRKDRPPPRLLRRVDPLVACSPLDPLSFIDDNGDHGDLTTSAALVPQSFALQGRSRSPPSSQARF